MSLSWDEMIAERRRADLLIAAAGRPDAITGITADSRTATPGSVYLAMRGSQADGHTFVPDVAARGAAAVVVETPQAVGVPEIVVRDGRQAAIALASAWYGHPARQLKLIGVTGTNGKTTTVGLLRHLLNAGGTAGSIGTIGAVDGQGRPVTSTAGTLTTPGPVDLQATLAALVERGVTDVAMEASSHSLDQGRLDGLRFAAGVFTNVTRDHLDYHGTMEAYLGAKLKLARLLGVTGVAVVSADDSAWQALAPPGPPVTFGVHPDADVRGCDIRLDARGSRFSISGRFGSAGIELPLLGDFNVLNALAAAACALALDEPLREVAGRLASAPQVAGRMERLAEHPCVVLRDYAHTPDALERALRTLRPLTAGRLVVVFGCGGDRDRGKRPLMGRVAAEIADLAVVTSDNPRSEDPDAIIDEIEAGMGTTEHVRLSDRLDAIRYALESRGAKDTVLLAGKGHEIYQIVGAERRPFDEREIVQQLVSGKQ